MAEWLRRLHQRGRLLPLLREAAVEQFLLEHARHAGLTASAEELQQAADGFRRRHGLASAEQTNAWLAGRRLSVLYLEDVLERDLLIEKLRDHVTRERIEPHFADRRAEYDRVRVREVRVAREDLARELLTQIREEGADFAELARGHSLEPSRDRGGEVGWVRRRDLPAAAAGAVIGASAGQVVGPVAAAEGFWLFLVQATAPAELDEATRAVLREELFAGWLDEQLKGVPLRVPLLDVL